MGNLRKAAEQSGKEETFQECMKTTTAEDKEKVRGENQALGDEKNKLPRRRRGKRTQKLSPYHPGRLREEEEVEEEEEEEEEEEA